MVSTSLVNTIEPMIFVVSSFRRVPPFPIAKVVRFSFALVHGGEGHGVPYIAVGLIIQKVPYDVSYIDDGFIRKDFQHVGSGSRGFPTFHLLNSVSGLTITRGRG
jgi:hypothetical protein